MFEKFIPQETSFFDFFEQHISFCKDIAKELVELSLSQDEILLHIKRIKELEHHCDGITHSCIEALQKTFITPFDRADIHNLIKTLDDIADAIDEATSRLEIYEIKEVRPEVHSFGQILVRATSEIEAALKCLRNMKYAEELKQHCINIHQCENDGDRILMSALSRLFKESDQPVMIIKWKEIFDQLELATDCCEDVADIIQGVAIEAS